MDQAKTEERTEGAGDRVGGSESSSGKKARPLLLARLLYERTDAERGVTMNEILAYLSEHGISAERKAVYRDIKLLRSCGIAAAKLNNGAAADYGLVRRLFSLAELQLAVDAVESLRFLTDDQVETIVSKLKELAPVYQRDRLTTCVHVANRVETQADDVFEAIEAIRRALALKRQVRFRYYEYAPDGSRRLRHGGRFYEVTPITLAHANDLYYLIAYDAAHKDEHEGIRHYRVDRMTAASVAEDFAVHNAAIASLDVEAHVDGCVNMYQGDEPKVNVHVAVDVRVLQAFIDRFGSHMHVGRYRGGAAGIQGTRDARSTGDGGETVRVRASFPVFAGPTFYGWLAQFGRQVEILGPASVKHGYLEHLEEIAEVYRSEEAELPDAAGAES